MESIMIVIVTDDKEYGRSLSLGMLSVCRSFIIRIFTAEEFLDKERDFDIVLWDGEEVKDAFGGRIVYLAEKPSDVVKSLSDKRFCLYKYCPASCMVASIFEIYNMLTGRCAVNLKRQEVRIFAFASYMGGVGCTTLALAAAQEISRFQGKKVFYLSFEEIESTAEYFESSVGLKGASVYLYELFNKIYSNSFIYDSVECKTPFLEGKIVRDDYGVETFAVSGGRNPMREVNTDELDRLLASIIDSGRYDVLILDIGQWLSKTGVKCISLAEKLCLISSAYNGYGREEQYICHLVSHCGEEVMKKVINVINKDKSEGTVSVKGGKKESIYEKCIRVSKSRSFTKAEGHTGIILEGSFGESINRLVSELSEPIQ